MNNATLVLNVARPVTPAPSPAPGAAVASSAAGKTQDDTASNKRFDAAMDAAHADARKTKDQPADKGATTTSVPTSASKDPGADKTTVAQAGDKKPDDDATKKDDATDGDTSLATSVLALIGVPPKGTYVAAKALASATTAAGKLGAALGAVGGAGGTPGLAVTPDATVAVKEGAGSGLPAMEALAPAPVAVAAASPFASLLAAQGGDLVANKDDAATDPTSASPMPLLHAPAMAGVAAPAVQVQATQAATSPQFSQELGEQIAWMGSGEVKSARIKLHPEELGSMDVHVTMDGGKVNVAILAQHPAAVHAVQQTLSQLDTMLAHHGLSLGETNVGQRDAGQQAPQGGSTGGQGGAVADDAASTDVVATSRVSRSLVDEVA
ncbi:MAG TPA: flagellar hook-length control protein FliK [Luteibacter sp.]|uniref:flagellar hook-length control protein FliK n=1 Tax=Luteibacter sp. TaxID=1886636 RepID=UPI002C3F03D9|nr:flagellar hook-length control protein FliK [Luteibacter sp.]HVI54132.1 flagellar hook-length control protein FliK [Luteibacter sp.]